MLRFQTALSGALATVLVVPAFLGQGQIGSLQDALAGTRRALDVLKSLEQRLHDEPASTLGLILSATESPRGDEAQRDRELEQLRNEVSLLQMELDSMQSPVLGADGAVQSALGAHVPLDGRASSSASPQAGITTGIDDDMRAFLSAPDATRAPKRGENAPRDPSQAQAAPAGGAAGAYSADPLRNGIACYRAGRFAEAYELLAPLADANALYWQARTLERLERLDEAVTRMERAIAKAAESKDAGGFDARRAQTDLEFLRWKRDFVKNLPASKKAAEAPR